MKWLFLFLLKKYTKNENNRLEIFNVLHEKISDEYSEETTFGNVYNANVEFLMGNDLVNKLIRDNDKSGLDMLKVGLYNSFDDAINFMVDEGFDINIKKRTW